MPLLKQVLSLPMIGGLDQKKGEKHRELQKLEQCKNGAFAKTGEIHKRTSFTRNDNLTATGTIATGKACASYGDERLVFDGLNGYTRSSSGTWVDKGRITGCTQTDEYINSDQTVNSTPAQCATANGYRVEAWSESDPVLVSGLVTDVPWFVYARVIDTATGAEVVGKTLLSDPAGMNVTKYHQQHYESSYITPQAQVVVDGDLIYIVFMGWVQGGTGIPVFTVTGATSAASGTKTTLALSQATGAHFLEGDTVAVSGSTGYDGSWEVSDATSGSITIPKAFGSATTAGSAAFSTFARKIYASVVDTGSGISAGLTPSTNAMSSSPLCYVHGSYPLFVVDKDPLGTGAVIFRTSPNRGTPYETKFRADLFHSINNQLVERTVDNVYGRAGNGSIPAGTPYFQAEDANYASTQRTLSHIACKTIAAHNRIVCLFTNEAEGAPVVTIMVLDASLVQQGGLVAMLSPRVLISAGLSDDWVEISNSLPFAGCLVTAQSPDPSTHQSTPDDGQAAHHEIYKTHVELTTNAKMGTSLLKHFSTVTTDPFSYGGRVYFGATRAITPRARAALVGGAVVETDRLNFGSSVNLVADIDGNIVSTSGTGLGGSCASTDWAPILQFATALFWHVQRVENPSAGVFGFGSSKYGGVTDGLANPVFSGRSVFNPSYSQMDFSPARYLPSVEAGGALLLASGVLWEYSGDAFKESGFLTYPQVRGATTSTTGGTMEAGAYSYRAVYEWVSRSGTVHRSYPSDPESVVVQAGNTNKVEIELYTPEWTQKRRSNGLAAARVVLYRNEKDGGTIFYRVASVEATDTLGPTVTITDIIQDLALVDNEQIYSTGTPGDILGNIAPPSQTDVMLHKERVFLATVNGSLWYSKRLVPRVAAEFSEGLVKPVENYTGKISAIGSLRERVVVFTEKHGYTLSGEGPNSAGAGMDFTPVTRFAEGQGAPAGCVRITTPGGFIFRSDRGLYTVTEGMRVQYIGAGVEDEVAAVAPVAAAIDDSKNHVYFLQGGSRGVLVYNYYYNEWCKWEVGGATSAFTNIASGMFHNGTLNLLHVSGELSEQGAGYFDRWVGGSPPQYIDEDYQLVVQTSWLRSSIFLGMARFYRFLVSGVFPGAHDIQVTTEYDYDGSVTTTSTSLELGPSSLPEIVRTHLKHQKSRAVRFTISASKAAGESAGPCLLDGIGLEIGTKKPGTTFKRPPARTV